MPGKPKKEIKITFTADLDHKRIKAVFVPKPDKTTKPDDYINALIAGMRLGFGVLFSGMDLLRPATDEEREAHIYIFKDQEPDNKLFNARKVLYDKMSAELAAILHEAFVDVEYIEETRKYQQELVYDMNADAAKEHLAKIEEIAKHIREAFKDEETRPAS